MHITRGYQKNSTNRSRVIRKSGDINKVKDFLAPLLNRKVDNEYHPPCLKTAQALEVAGNAEAYLKWKM